MYSTPTQSPDEILARTQPYVYRKVSHALAVLFESQTLNTIAVLQYAKI